jgi:hypothetical protein
MPRFMYVNGEIVKRKDAVHINVSSLSIGVSGGLMLRCRCRTFEI